jgi:hypothetical protein
VRDFGDIKIHTLKSDARCGVPKFLDLEGWDTEAMKQARNSALETQNWNWYLGWTFNLYVQWDDPGVHKLSQGFATCQ